jgi:hypothetical protein
MLLLCRVVYIREYSKGREKSNGLMLLHEERGLDYMYFNTYL